MCRDARGRTLVDQIEDKPQWPGQVVRLFFDLPQAKSIASPTRSLIFWSLDWSKPKSAADIGEEIGKAPATVRYHMAELAEQGLILAVDSRKRRSRIETLYVRKAKQNFYQTNPEGDLYHRYTLRGLKLDSQKMIREFAYSFGWSEHEPTTKALAYHRKHHMMLTFEQAEILKRRISDLIADTLANQTPRDQGGVEVNMTASLGPTLYQTKLWAKERGIAFQELNRDGIPSEDEPEE